jgi:hypothetical protein
VTSANRPRFLSTDVWFNYFAAAQAQIPPLEVNLYSLKSAVYLEIEEHRGRPLLVYAVKFTGGGQNFSSLINIDQGDVDGFTDLVAAVPSEHKAVDVLIHSPGGSPEATERIVALLRNRFDDVQFIVPHSAFSAATMLALSGNKIILHSSATLGPIDPQLNGMPARSIRRGFDKVRDLLQREGPDALPAYIPLIEKHSLEILELCDDSLQLSKDLVSEWLGEYMFAGRNAEETISRAVEFFSSYDTHKTHSRPLMFGKLKNLGLEISIAESPLSELMREAYILMNAFFTHTIFVKIFENAHGLSWGRQVHPQQQPQQPSPETVTAGE